MNFAVYWNLWYIVGSRHGADVTKIMPANDHTITVQLVVTESIEAKRV